MGRAEVGEHSQGRHDIALIACLGVAVPLRIHELRAMTEIERDRVVRIWAEQGGDALASGGDCIKFRTPYTPASERWSETLGTARMFNLLAKALAAAAHIPGGVSYAGLHWEVTTGGEAARVAPPNDLREPEGGETP